MIDLDKRLNKFIIFTLKILMFILVGVSIKKIYTLYNGLNFEVILTGGIYILSICILDKIIRSRKIGSNVKLILILVLSLLLRITWLINVDSMPVSDFETMYSSAGRLLNGDIDMFYDNSYFARFPHLTLMVLYMALMRKLFPINNLIVMKFNNVIFGILIVFLIYIIIKEIFKSERYALYGASITVLFPPLITYVAVFCTENIAIMFYLFSLFLFLRAIKSKNKIILFSLSGVILAVGNLFRMVAVIIIIAYVMYIVIYDASNFKDKAKSILGVVLSYSLVILMVSSSLQGLGITENPLWRGSEPKITSILKGTNIESGGRWNTDDAKISKLYNYDYEKVEKVSKDIIISRFKNTPVLDWGRFYIRKFAFQWNKGDMSGVYWSILDVPDEEIIVNLLKGGEEVLQLFYVLILILVLIGLFNKSLLNKYKEINLIYIILCGYGASYLITESQDRYSYIACWIFILLAIVGIDYIEARRLNYNEKKHKQQN